MVKLNNYNKLNLPKELSGIVDFFIYNLNDDKITISSSTKKLLNLKEEENCSLIHLMSFIVGVDIPGFIQNLKHWKQGNTSEIIKIRIIDVFEKTHCVQIKGHTRYDEKGNIVSLYGAYFNVNAIYN